MGPLLLSVFPLSSWNVRGPKEDGHFFLGPIYSPCYQGNRTNVWRTNKAQDDSVFYIFLANLVAKSGYDTVCATCIYFRGKSSKE